MIRLSFDGAESVKINKSGDLVLSLKGGEVVLKAPVAYQEKDGKRVKVERAAINRYVTGDLGLVAFMVGSYDKSAPLVIDPVLSYSTLIGGSGCDFCYGITVDGSGNMYVVGYTEDSTTFDITIILWDLGFR